MQGYNWTKFTLNNFLSIKTKVLRVVCNYAFWDAIWVSHLQYLHFVNSDVLRLMYISLKPDLWTAVKSSIYINVCIYVWLDSQCMKIIKKDQQNKVTSNIRNNWWQQRIMHCQNDQCLYTNQKDQCVNTSLDNQINLLYCIRFWCWQFLVPQSLCEKQSQLLVWVYVSVCVTVC